MKWGQPNMLNADLKCIKQLVNLNKERIIKNDKSVWKYTSSQAGVELPIVTYAKFHKTLENLGESSSVESFAFNQVPKNSSEHSIFNSTNKQLLLRLTKNQRKDCLNCVDKKNTNGWNLEPKFNTYLCDIEMGGSSARSSVSSRHNQVNTCIRESVIQEEREEEIESNDNGNDSRAIERGELF